MDNKKSSKSKRSKVESTNNIKNYVKKNHQVDQKKQDKKPLKIKNNDEVKNECNELAESNKKEKKNNIILLNLPCETEGEDKIKHGDNVLESPSSAYKCVNNKKHNFNKNGQNQRKISDKDDKYDQIKKYNGNDTHSYEDTCISVDTDGKKSAKINNKHKISYQSNYSKKNDQQQRKNEISTGNNFQQNKAQDRNIALHKKSLINLKDRIIEEIDEDLFKLSKDYSLAHCVAEDLQMGAGIAVEFKRIFGGVGKLADQNLKIGDVGIIHRHNQYAFYLITKKYSHGKPTMNTMEKALRSLFIQMKKFNLTKLAIPKIGCGLDKLNWFDVRSLIIDIFSGSGINITVCIPSKLSDSKTPQRLKVYITPSNLWEMLSQTIIVLFIDLEQVCKNNWEDYIVDKVNTKYPFKENLLKDVKNKKFEPGAITKYNINNEVIICMFVTQNALYSSLEDGFKFIDKTFKYYKYLAIQSGPIEPSNNFKHISLIVLIFRSIFHSCELWLCGDVNQRKNIYYDEYCKNLHNSINYSFQSSSPTQNNNKYNDNCQNFNVKETSNQN